MDNSTKKTIAEIKSLIGKKLTIESVIFSEDDGENFDPNFDEMPTDMGQPETQAPQQMQKPQNDNRSESDIMGDASPEIQRRVNGIRRMALEGVTALAEKPLSTEYEFFKKIFMDCDKLFSNKNNNK